MGTFRGRKAHRLMLCSRVAPAVQPGDKPLVVPHISENNTLGILGVPPNAQYEYPFLLK
jgi:hypothetical protein